MLDDQQLLRRYAAGGSEPAFRELVERHLNLVYSAALRRVGNDAHLAQDVAQLVFTDLARKAHSLPSNMVLAGWLHRASRYAAAQLMRTNQRRQQREQEAVAMNDLKSESTDWTALRPTLDDALDQLNQTDRDALLLRFFEQRSLTEIGIKLGTNEDAARKRVNRALDKLRAILVRRGLTTTGAALSAVISAHAVQFAPTGLAATLTTASLASAGSASGITLTALKIMSLTKAQIAIGTAAVALLTATLLFQHESQIKLRQENESLRQRLAQLDSDNQSLSDRLARSESLASHLSVTPIQITTSTNSADNTMQSTNFYNRLKDKNLKLTVDQLDAYLKKNGRSAASLLAAYRTTGDRSLLAEAMRNFPNDPQVAYEAALFEAHSNQDASPQERRQWLDSLKQLDPDNAMADYLSAADYLKAGQTNQAIKEMTAGANKSFQDYTAQRYQDDVEAFLAAGYSSTDAKYAAMSQLLLPQLFDTKNLGLGMIDLAKSYQQQGDTTSAQATLQMAMNLGQSYGNPSPGEPIISELVGIAVERAALNAMDPNAPYGNTGQTVQDYLNQLTQQKDALQQRATEVGAIMPQVSEQDFVIYRDRAMMFGEQNAAQWIISKYAQN